MRTSQLDAQNGHAHRPPWNLGDSFRGFQYNAIRKSPDKRERNRCNTWCFTCFKWKSRQWPLIKTPWHTNRNILRIIFGWVFLEMDPRCQGVHVTYQHPSLSFWQTMDGRIRYLSIVIVHPEAPRKSFKIKLDSQIFPPFWGEKLQFSWEDDLFHPSKWFKIPTLGSF